MKKLFCLFLQGLKGYVLDFAKLRFRDIAYTEGFASLDKKLTTQLIRELIVNRKLAERMIRIPTRNRKKLKMRRSRNFV